ncbi:stage III sporulation protein SpoIIIAB [Clostridium sp. DJ247]|uniref:stage III sporulation protein SpoIIIAB n=1 Tax=Clostridium sp. DJ247 TaxID=2726188 RepID=UPI00162A0277|nr:stage III sporulation protein SpoIIIAB [Clostridium sp. DJ247]MBC2580321.1 stage III sporulation protein SpoAB [Clostridium sp. DJ247]
MIRVLGCIIILFASTGIGFIYSESFKKRTAQLNEFQRCIYQLQNEIIYTHTPLPKAISNIAEKSVHPVKLVFDEISSLLCSNVVDTVYEAFYKVFSNKQSILNLKGEDINVILDLAKNLGESDLEGQKKIFTLSLENLKKQIKDSELSMKNNVKMYRYLGFSLGAMLVIVLI